MNFRNHKLYLVVRTIVGLLFAASGAAGLLAGNSTQGVPPQMIPITQAFWSAGIIQMIKTTELVSGLMLVFGFLPALASIFLAPVCVGILIFNSRVFPQLAFVGVVLCLLNAYLGYAQWDKYKALFKKD